MLGSYTLRRTQYDRLSQQQLSFLLLLFNTRYQSFGIDIVLRTTNI